MSPVERDNVRPSSDSDSGLMMDLSPLGEPRSGKSSALNERIWSLPSAFGFHPSNVVLPVYLVSAVHVEFVEVWRASVELVWLVELLPVVDVLARSLMNKPGVSSVRAGSSSKEKWLGLRLAISVGYVSVSDSANICWR